MKVHPMWDTYPSLQKELEAIILLIEENITIKNPEVQGKIKELLFSGGKSLRPAYSILFSNFSQSRDEKKAQAIAAAIEVLHMATLVHDDVIDESDTRRGQETLNSTYNNRIAIYTGDYLFTVCFRILQSYAKDAAALQLDTRGIETILIGELDQMSRRYNPDMRMRDYLSQIKGKTAQLFALSCYSGAYQEEDSQKLARQAFQIGEHIGMAFQIVDDILDYSVDTVKIGKPALQDLRNGIYTAPLLYALQTKRTELKPYLLKKENITDEEVAVVLEIVQAAGGLKKAQRLAEKYTKKALDKIAKLPENKSKVTLSRITEQVGNRDY